jgi:hypothetical protein
MTPKIKTSPSRPRAAPPWLAALRASLFYALTVRADRLV